MINISDTCANCEERVFCELTGMNYDRDSIIQAELISLRALRKTVDPNTSVETVSAELEAALITRYN